MNIEPFPTARLAFKIEPAVLAVIDEKASRLGATRSYVARALIRNAVEQLRYSEAGIGK